ncbi:DinB family protein [Alcaligenes faecalis]|uniref:DinB family protein n=1 Tax=Alcaligenes faecalis TaxID=511 RepID=UPI000A2E9EC0|nr:DinB family protein [Alcaligenes faecalis]KAA1285872.1 damage-inducible protein DinB [Alcaligenes faecalis]OSZ37759.1 damage-inducible protein DinB [Alcaligenes faecalis]OSZ47132.1 damage-inducible protein DinB [Alcaligenes faecalis]
MTPQAAIRMASYNSQMNQRLYDAAASLSAQDLHQERGAFFGSLFKTMMHIAVGDTVWLHRFAQHPDAHVLREEIGVLAKPHALDQQLFDTLMELDQYRHKLDLIIIDWAATLTPEQLGQTLRYSNMAGQSMEKDFALLVTHFFNHQTHHRGQASTLLYQAGVDIGVTDLLALVS